MIGRAPKRRRFLMFEWDTLLPVTGRFPVIWQTLDMTALLRGRVFSVYFWALQGVAPFGSIVIGSMAQKWSVPSAAIFAGTICLLGIIVIRFVLRNGRKSEA